MKRGEMVGSTVVELIIAVVGVTFLIFFMFMFFAPGYNQAREISKSYNDRLEGELEGVFEGGEGEFIIFEMQDDFEFYLVYFGEKKGLDMGEEIFTTSKSGDNVVCSCYVISGESICKYCFDSKLPLKFVGKGVEGDRIFGEGSSFGISKRGDYYEFNKK